MRDTFRASGLLAFAIAIPLFTAARASAQGWTAQLVLSPVASPFLSDWELDPTLAQLIVTSPASSATDVTFHYSLTRNGQVLLRGTTDPQTIPAREAVVFTGSSTFGGRADWNRDVQQIVARTGRLPEGEYEGCVTLAGPGGIVLVERQCARFSTQSSDPPFLVFPMNGDTVTSRDPIFEWQPVQVPAMADARIGYVLQIAEVRSRQLPEVALQSNILHYVEPNLVQTSHQYPVGGLPLVSGRTYAWRVQALDGDGRPAAANQGRSEIWTFVYREPESEARAAVARLELNPPRDTLRFAGDTARFEATAYDADNVEIRGKRVQWRALDTTVALVDSTGVVTGAGAGETRIVALVDGVADSALSVTAPPTRIAVRFQRYDASTDKPTLLEVLQSGSFDEVVPKVMDLLQSGELRIPIPRLPGVGSGQADSGEPETDDGARGGPRDGPVASARVADACDVLSTDASVSVDRSRKVWALHLAATSDLWRCLNPALPEERDTLVHRSVVFAASWKHPGLPRVFAAIKQVGGFPLPLPLLGTMARTSYTVVNLLLPVELDNKVLPADYDGFFGTESFEAGRGLTIYSKIRCLDASWPLCQFFSWINPENPEMTITAFAGVTAGEASIGGGTKTGPTDSGIKRVKVGASGALGFSIEAQLPVRIWDVDIGQVSLDSTQVGFIFAAQDSMVSTTGETKEHNKSLDLGVTLTTWVKGSRDHTWQIDGMVAFEWDPNDTTDAGATNKKPKLVVSTILDQVWQLGVARLGNPTLIFTTPLFGRDQPVATTLALSGSWGFGPNNGFGFVTDENAFGFEEVGRGQVTFEWKRPNPEESLESKRAKRDAATAAMMKQVRVVGEARKRVAAARNADPGAREAARDAERHTITQASKNSTGLLAPPTPEPAASTLAAAERELEKAEKELKALIASREAAREAMAPAPSTCLATIRGRCVTWSASLSVGNGSVPDIAALIFRTLTGLQ